MKVVREDLWDVPLDDERTVFVVTTNCTLRQDGSLVMGTGAAQAAVRRYGEPIKYAAGMAVSRKLAQRLSCHIVGPQGQPSLEDGTPLPLDDFGFDSRFYGFLNVSAVAVDRGGPERKIEEFSIFQVKYDWWNNAEIALIHRSALMLERSARHNPTWKYRMNFPGIGRGNLSADHVLPYLLPLPDNVTICTK